MNPQQHEFPDGTVLVLREATPSDARAVRDHVEAISQESEFTTRSPGELPTSLEEEEAYIQSFPDADNQVFLIGVVDEAIVGTLNFKGGRRQRTRHAGEFGMGVRQSWWGRGIGAMLIERLIAWAEGTEIVRKINLRVREDNTRAIRLYERSGFVREGVLQREFLVRGQFYALVSMGREL